MVWRKEDYAASMTRDEAGSMMWMDPVHVEAIYMLCELCRFDHVVEIGCWDGFSTSAVVQHNRDGGETRLSCVDVDVRPRLFNVLKCNTQPWTVHQMNSLVFLKDNDDADCLVLDGDHSLDQVTKEWSLLCEQGVGVLIAHDVGQSAGDVGPQWLLSMLAASSNWMVFRDEKPRAGQRTDRGLMVATCHERYAIAVRKVKSWLTGQD